MGIDEFAAMTDYKRNYAACLLSIYRHLVMKVGGKTRLENGRRKKEY